MKITFDFNCMQDGDCTLLRGVMKGLTSALEDITTGQTEEEAPALEPEQSTAVEAPAEQSTEATEVPVEKPKRARRKKNTENEAKSEEAGESSLSAVTADPGVQDKPASEEASTDLPFPEGEEMSTPAEPDPQEEVKITVEPAEQEVKPSESETKQTMTPQDFRAALEDLRKKLGVEPETPESLALARYISTLSDTTYGTAKPSKLPADKLADFVNRWMRYITWNGTHDGFEMNEPPF